MNSTPSYGEPVREYLAIRVLHNSTGIIKHLVIRVQHNSTEIIKQTKSILSVKKNSNIPQNRLHSSRHPFLSNDGNT
jgi:hypothetical protein